MFGRILLAVLTLIAIAGIGGAQYLISAYFPGTPLWVLFVDAVIVIKLLMVLAAMLLVTTLVMAPIKGNGLRTVLTVFAFGGLGLGVLGALYGWTNTQVAISKIGPVSFEATAPGYAEDLLCLGFGAFSGAVAAAVRLFKPS